MAPLNLAQDLGIAPALHRRARTSAASSSMSHVAHARAAIGAGPVRRRADRLRLDAAARRARERVGAGARPLGGAVPPAAAAHRLRARRLAPHARVRHDARAARRGRGRRARAGRSCNPKRLVARPAERRRRARLAHGLPTRWACATAAWSPTAAARSCHDRAERAARAASARRCSCWAAARRIRHRHISGMPDLTHDGRGAVRRAGLRARPGSGPPTSAARSSTTPSRSRRSCSSRTSASAPGRGRAARRSPAAGSRPAARCR